MQAYSEIDLWNCAEAQTRLGHTLQNIRVLLKIKRQEFFRASISKKPVECPFSPPQEDIHCTLYLSLAENSRSRATIIGKSDFGTTTAFSTLTLPHVTCDARFSVELPLKKIPSKSGLRAKVTA